MGYARVLWLLLINVNNKCIFIRVFLKPITKKNNLFVGDANFWMVQLVDYGVSMPRYKSQSPCSVWHQHRTAKEKWFSFAGLPRAVAGFNNVIIRRISDDAVNILCISDDLSTCLLDWLLKQPLKPKMFFLCRNSNISIPNCFSMDFSLKIRHLRVTTGS